jgi:hypothetical protein
MPNACERLQSIQPSAANFRENTQGTAPEGDFLAISASGSVPGIRATNDSVSVVPGDSVPGVDDQIW